MDNSLYELDQENWKYPEIQRETLNEYIAEMENLNDKINRFMNRIDEMYQEQKIP